MFGLPSQSTNTSGFSDLLDRGITSRHGCRMADHYFGRIDTALYLGGRYWRRREPEVVGFANSLTILKLKRLGTLRSYPLLTGAGKL